LTRANPSTEVCLQAQVVAQRVVDCSHADEVKVAHLNANPLRVNCTNLLSLGLAVARQARGG
jgi:hypothetical protein